MHLNIPPDRRGRVADHDAAVLKSFGDAQAQTYARDLAQGAVAHASAERGRAFAASRVLDGRRDTYWSTPDGDTTPTLTLDLPPGRTFDVIRLREYLPLGVRVTKFAIDLEEAGQWRTVAEHECISAQRIVRLPQPSSARRLRLRILEAPACPAISEISLYRQVQPVSVAPPKVSDPTIIPRQGWSIVTASGPGAEKLIDGEAQTRWTVPSPTAADPASVTIDLGRVLPLAGFSLTPSRTIAKDTAPPRGYAVETSADGKNWVPAATGEFANIAYALATQRVPFAVRQARYLRLRFDAPAIPAGNLTIAEIGAFTG
jgi:alpha-L-fucosidase